MLNLQALQDEVARNRQVDASAKQVITNLLDQLEAAKGDQAKIDSLIADFRGSTDELAAAIQTATPADPNAPPVEG